MSKVIRGGARSKVNIPKGSANLVTLYFHQQRHGSAKIGSYALACLEMDLFAKNKSQLQDLATW